VTRVALLDVNVLVALFDPDHVHHDLAHDWFADNRADGWATCPATESAFIRVLANPAYGSPVASVAALSEHLCAFCESADHVFWPEDVSLCDSALFDLGKAGGHRHLTDVYLLGLATHKGGRLVTFDRRIPWAAVRGASPDTIIVVSDASAP
jgi:toxin-antitoxin system PIN domain toxin